MTAIVQTLDVIGGKPRIDGHRISVQDIVVWHEQMGMSVDTIVAEYGLTLDDVRAALLYYIEHRDEIDAAIRDDETFIAEMRAMRILV